MSFDEEAIRMGKLEANKKKKKNALYNTAFDLFTTKGIAKTTISDIVENAGVAKGTFYLYFRDKYDIRNKLVSHKTGELFFQAHEALLQTELTEFEEQIHFIVNFILDLLEKNPSLLTFISKNLAWGVFKGSFEEKIPDDEYNFYESYLHLLEGSNKTYDNPELMLFTIIEMVGSTCYSCILYSQPTSLNGYKPYLHKCVDGILNSFQAA
jgi:AcrR family transcriptional regulator